METITKLLNQIWLSVLSPFRKLWCVLVNFKKSIWLALFQREELTTRDPDWVGVESCNHNAQSRLARLIGYIAFLWPVTFGLWAVLDDAHARPELEVCFYDSLSHYWYSPLFGGVFVACLVFISVLLLSWRGENEHESRLANWAAVFALLVALVPTMGTGCEEQAFSVRPFAEVENRWLAVDAIEITQKQAAEATDNSHLDAHHNNRLSVAVFHYISAAGLLLIIALFSLRVFTRIKDKHKIMQTSTGNKFSLTKAKWWRNKVYYFCGVVMMGCFLALVGGFAAQKIWVQVAEAWPDYNLTFWVEAVFMVSFGLAWLVKSRLIPVLNDE